MPLFSWTWFDERTKDRTALALMVCSGGRSGNIAWLTGNSKAILAAHHICPRLRKRSSKPLNAGGESHASSLGVAAESLNRMSASAPTVFSVYGARSEDSLRKGIISQKTTFQISTTAQMLTLGRRQMNDLYVLPGSSTPTGEEQINLHCQTLKGPPKSEIMSVQRVKKR